MIRRPIDPCQPSDETRHEMKLQQLRYVWAVVQHDLNVSQAAQALFTSQPGISKQIRLLEEELGVEIFTRHGKHLTALTAAGAALLKPLEGVLREAEAIRQVAQEFRGDDRGVLTLAVTHMQARYRLPAVLALFREAYPDVALTIHQGAPQQVADRLAEGDVDLALGGESLEHLDGLVRLPAARHRHVVILPLGHAWAERPSIALADCAEQPLVTYELGYGGRQQLDAHCSLLGVTPRVVLTATDAEVIKSYVAMGLGIGVVVDMTVTPEDASRFVIKPLSDPAPVLTTWVAVRRGQFLRRFQKHFIRCLVPDITDEHLDHLDPIEPERLGQPLFRHSA